jgi:hypothetical protein
MCGDGDPVVGSVWGSVGQTKILAHCILASLWRQLTNRFLNGDDDKLTKPIDQRFCYDFTVDGVLYPVERARSKVQTGLSTLQSAGGILNDTEIKKMQIWQDAV